MLQEQDNDKVVQGLISVVNKLILVIVVLVAGIIAITILSAIAGTWLYGYIREKLPH
jgi:hypothetical protein